MSSFPCRLTRNIITENLAFHGLPQMKDDYTTNYHYITYTFLLKRWENILFELSGCEKVNRTLSIIFPGIPSSLDIHHLRPSHYVRRIIELGTTITPSLPGYRTKQQYLSRECFIANPKNGRVWKACWKTTFSPGRSFPRAFRPRLFSRLQNGPSTSDRYQKEEVIPWKTLLFLLVDNWKFYQMRESVWKRKWAASRRPAVWNCLKPSSTKTLRTRTQAQECWKVSGPTCQITWLMGQYAHHSNVWAIWGRTDLTDPGHQNARVSFYYWESRDGDW